MERKKKYYIWKSRIYIRRASFASAGVVKRDIIAIYTLSRKKIWDQNRAEKQISNETGGFKHVKNTSIDEICNLAFSGWRSKWTTVSNEFKGIRGFTQNFCNVHALFVVLPESRKIKQRPYYLVGGNCLMLANYDSHPHGLDYFVKTIK